MNKQLFLASLKETQKYFELCVWCGFIFVVINLIFPSMVSAKGLNELIAAMPDSVKKSLVWKVRFKT